MKRKSSDLLEESQNNPDLKESVLVSTMKKTKKNEKASYAELKVQDIELFYETFLLDHKEYEWFYIKDEKIYCKYCDDIYQPGSHKYKLAGSKNFQNSTLEGHDTSGFHVTAAKSRDSRQQRLNEPTTWTANMPEVPEDKHLQLLKNMYYLAKKNNIALSQYETLNQHFKESGVLMPSSFLSNKSGRGILHTLGYSICLDIAKQARKSPTLGLMFDEGTNINGTKDLVIHVQYLEGWRQKSQFLALVPLQAYKAIDIFKTLHKLLDHLGLLSNLVAITTDGARIMLGEDGGVTRIFRNLVNKSIVNLHCTAHCVNLITKDFIEGFTVVNTLYESLKKLDSKIAKSSIKIERLFELEEKDGLKQLTTHKPTKVRWLSLNTSLLRFFLIYKPLIAMLNEFPKDMECQALLSTFKTYSNIGTMAFLADITSIQARTCKLFQEDYLQLNNVFRSVESTITEIKRYIESPNVLSQGDHLSDFINSVNKDGKYKDFNVRRALLDEYMLKKRIKGIATMIVTGFSRITEQKPILKAISYFTVENIRKKVNPDITVEEIDYLDCITKHFNLGHSTLIKEEYRQLKPLIVNDYSSLQPLQILQKVFNEDSFEYCSKIFQINLALAISTAQCERSFSFCTYIKNRWRNRIGPASLNSLLHIKINTKSKDDVDFPAMYSNWRSATSEMYHTLLKPEVNGKIEPEDLNSDDEDNLED